MRIEQTDVADQLYEDLLAGGSEWLQVAPSGSKWLQAHFRNHSMLSACFALTATNKFVVAFFTH